MTDRIRYERESWDALATFPRDAVWSEADYEACAIPCRDFILRAFRPQDHLLLDLGCGIGRIATLTIRHVVGVDISYPMLRAAEIPFDRVCNDGRTLPFHDGIFDGAYSMLLFQHLPADAVAGYIHEVARVLRPGGRFRFQFVEDQGQLRRGHLSFDHRASEMARWCRTAGLEWGEAAYHLYPEWLWVTASKP